MFKRALIIGASRGLGRALALYLPTHINGLEAVVLVSRKVEKLNAVKTEMGVADSVNARLEFDKDKVEVHGFDMTQPEQISQTINLLREGQFDLVIYAAGGGPHGNFIDKEWKDHTWALKVGLLAPMELAHEWLNSRKNKNSEGRFIIVGSRIAEQNPDPQASSYAASKHGLMGFVSSIQNELASSPNKVWLFSPGYLDSEMLPSTAIVRHDGSTLMAVETAAQALLRWIKKDGPWHRVLK